jgi:hypothetical protein
MQRGSPPISPFVAIANIEKFDLTTSFFSSLLVPVGCSMDALRCWQQKKQRKRKRTDCRADPQPVLNRAPATLRYIAREVHRY